MSFVPSVPEGNTRWTNQLPPYVLCQYASPPPPYAEVAPYGHITLARFTPVKPANQLDVSIGAHSCSSGGDASFLDATALSIGNTFQRRSSSPTPSDDDYDIAPEPATPVSRDATLPLGLTEPAMTQSYSSAIRRSRSVDASTVQHHRPLLLPPVHANPSGHQRTRHPSLPPFTASLISRPDPERVLEQLQASWLHPQQSHSPSHDQPRPPPPSEGEMLSSLQSFSFETVPQPAVSEDVQTGHRRKRRHRSGRNRTRVAASITDSPITSTAEVS